jgi:phosphogluconate dehydratase
MVTDPPALPRPLHPALVAVTRRIVERSALLRGAYLQRVDLLASRPRGSDRMGCANVAHAFAALPGPDKLRVVAERAPHLGVVTAYNDMLSAHQPYERYPDLIRAEARRLGATVQVAGGVPAMCDGVTQGLPGMELSLFSRDVIAQATAIALSHDVFDAALLLGVCDKIVPGLLIGALHFGHLPCVFVPAGTDGHGPVERRQVQGPRTGRPGPGRSGRTAGRRERGLPRPRHLHLLRHRQQQPDAAGGDGPARARRGLHPPARRCTRRADAAGGGPGAAAHTRAGADFLPIGRLVDERVIVNAMVALLATGGSTNHLIHWVAVARAAGILIDWSDFAELSAAVPLLARVYPNGEADVNQFQSAGGPGFVLRELLAGGLMHADVATVAPKGLSAYTAVPELDGERLRWTALPAHSPDTAVLRPVASPFSPTGGLRLLQGRLGRAVIKVSAVPDDRHVIEAPARVFDSQEDLLAAFNAGELQGDLVAVVRFQGPQANGMPELHKLTPPLAVLQGRGQRVALVTDGRMSGASGKVPAAIHVTPEALVGGPLSRVRNGDVIRLDAQAGTLDVLLDDSTWAERLPALRPDAQAAVHAHDLGRELFTGLRRLVQGAEQGAVTWL